MYLRKTRVDKGVPKKHGFCGTRLYKVWTSIIDRCCNPECEAYPRYGGRGIGICAEWRDAGNFCRWALANGYQRGKTIERVNNDGWYAPTNCTWADRVIQARNRRTSRLITYQGRTQSVAAWSEELGIPYRTLYERLRRGTPVERAFQPTMTSTVGLFEANGETHTLMEWAKLSGIHPTTISHRLAGGWSPSRAVTQPNSRGWRKGMGKS